MGKLSTALLAKRCAHRDRRRGFGAFTSFRDVHTDHPMELQGTVTEFKFTSPHTFIC